MKKWTAMFSGMAIATLLLTGCGTGTNNDTSSATQTKPVQNVETNTENQNSTIQNKDTNAAETTTQEQTSEKTSTTKSIPHEQTSEKTNEKALKYEFNGKIKEETAVLTTSDNQPFSLYILPQFALSGEEPGKDVLTFKDNDSIFMRIELLPTDVDWVATEKNVKAQLSSISKSITNPELSISNGSSYEVTNGNDVVTAVLIKDEKAPVRLTMFTTKDADYRQAFLEMAKTIQKK